MCATAVHDVRPGPGSRPAGPAPSTVPDDRYPVAALSALALSALALSALALSARARAATPE